MSQLLFKEGAEDQDSLLLERNNLLKKSHANQGVSELENAIKESTADLPLGKALNLLVNIHNHIFDKAVSTIRESTPAELTLKAIEMPTIRAFISIENYLSSCSDRSKSFRHIYDSLHEKFIKRGKSNSTKEPAMRVIGYLVLHSRQKEEIQQCICQELYNSDKRSQLAAVILIQFLFTTYISSENSYFNLAALFIQPLAQIAEKYGDSPTLLVCSSCDLALQLTKYIALHLNDPIEETEPSSKIMEVDTTSHQTIGVKIQQLSSAFEYADNLVYAMEKWNKSMDQLEIAAFKELHAFLHYATKNITDEGQQQISIEAWNLITTYLTPKSILSEKALSFKKQKSILLFENDQNTPLISFVKIVLIILSHKGLLVKLYGSDRSTVIYTNEEEEIKDLFLAEYSNIIQAYPIEEYKDIGSNLQVQLVTKLPFLCTTDDISSAALIQLIMEKTEYTKDTMQWLSPLVMKQPESSICNLLLHVIQQDEKSKSSFEFLGYLISLNSSEIIDILESNLLSVVKSSNQACELLIQCMAFTDLPLLIQKLIPMTIADNEREKMTCIALISKALLHEKWSSSSILLYIDLIRDVKSQKGFVTPVKSNFADLKKLTPNSITAYKQSVKKVIKEYGEEELEKICNDLIAPIQLWSTKIDNEPLGRGLVQLVYKSYGLPKDPICINAWRHLSFAFLNGHEFIWDVIEHCVNIMKSQISIPPTLADDKSEIIVFLQINPMLILQTIPKEAFDIVKLPKSYIDLLSSKIKMIDIDPLRIKRSTTTSTNTQLCIELMDELLSRSLDNSDTATIQFPIALLTKIFCE